MPDIAWDTGERARLRGLFELAEDSPGALGGGIGQGRVLVAWDEGEIVAFLQLVGSGEETELTAMAVAEHRQGEGIGGALVERAVAECRAEGFRTLLVATAAAGTGTLRFYQRQGFRMLRIERDAFMPADGYPDGIAIDGIPLRDRVWLSLAL